jgi:hypothetical protein
LRQRRKSQFFKRGALPTRGCRLSNLRFIFHSTTINTSRARRLI